MARGRRYKIPLPKDEGDWVMWILAGFVFFLRFVFLWVYEVSHLDNRVERQISRRQKTAQAQTKQYNCLCTCCQTF
jgi:hypothetical protein